MLQLLNYLRTYITEHFRWQYYLFTAVWLLVIFTINYTLDFDDSILDKIPAYRSRVLAQLLVLFTAFIVPAIFIARSARPVCLSRRMFWIKLLVALSFLAVYRALQLYPIFCEYAPFEGCKFQFLVFNRFGRLFLLLVPLLIFYWWDRRHLQSFYGLDFRFQSLKLYAPLLLIMAVVIFVACFFSEGLQAHYPLFLKSGGKSFAALNNIPEWLTVVMYEASYLFNFISIEFFFRGFFILAFVRLLGPQIVLPAVCLYATIHFGKPFIEAFGSIFGGYILSVLALKTENIWGGVLVHAGTAALMEFFAWLI
jgi:hypothetical protein